MAASTSGTARSEPPSGANDPEDFPAWFTKTGVAVRQTREPLQYVDMSKGQVSVLAKVPAEEFKLWLQTRGRNGPLMITAQQAKNIRLPPGTTVTVREDDQTERVKISKLGGDGTLDDVFFEGDKGFVKGAWTDQEDHLLRSLVEQYGARRWSFIATQFPGRIGKQCRERYLNHLDPSLCKEKWTAKEDAVILEARGRLGNQWAKMVRFLPGRTANDIKNHWNSTLRRMADQGLVPTNSQVASTVAAAVGSVSHSTGTGTPTRQNPSAPPPNSGQLSGPGPAASSMHRGPAAVAGGVKRDRPGDVSPAPMLRKRPNPPRPKAGQPAISATPFPGSPDV